MEVRKIQAERRANGMNHVNAYEAYRIVPNHLEHCPLADFNLIYLI